MTDFVIDTTATPKLTALLVGQRVDLLTLDVSGVQRRVEGDTIVVGNVVAKLTAGAAAALNHVLANAFTEGLTLAPRPCGARSGSERTALELCALALVRAQRDARSYAARAGLQVAARRRSSARAACSGW